jgi:uncharacterized protein (TIGR02231 family)
MTKGPTVASHELVTKSSKSTFFVYFHLLKAADKLDGQYKLRRYKDNPPPMRRLIFTLLASAALLLADEIPTKEAKVTEVTVYADRAEVMRQIKLNLTAGEHTLIFDNLPGSTDLGSVRVYGEGAFTLIDIRAETLQTLEVDDTRIRTKQAEINQVQRQRDELSKANNRVESQRAALDKVLARLTSVGKESINPEMDPAKWAAYLNFHTAELARLSQESIKNQSQLNDLAKESDRLTRELNELSQTRFRFHKVARVKIENVQPADITLTLAYLVTGAGWAPSYDLRADTKNKKLQVAYNAEVRQTTGEDWQSVTLKLSTAQPGLIGREPELSPWHIEKLTPLPAAEPVAAGAPMSVTSSQNLITGDRAKQQNQMFAQTAGKPGQDGSDWGFSRITGNIQVVQGGTSATFAIARKYDISANNKPVKVAIAEDAFPATFRYTCVPKLAPNVYLKTNAANKTDYPFLPGPTSVYLDGAFVAKSYLDLVPAGQEFWTYLGVDQNITVERKELAKREEKGGLFNSKTARTVYDYVFKVNNAKTLDSDLVIWDQLPVSNHEEIKVLLEEPKYTKDTEDFKMNEQKFVEWHLQLKPSEKRDIPFRFIVERPENFPIVGQ